METFTWQGAFIHVGNMSIDVKLGRAVLNHVYTNKKTHLSTHLFRMKGGTQIYKQTNIKGGELHPFVCYLTKNLAKLGIKNLYYTIHTHNFRKRIINDTD